MKYVFQSKPPYDRDTEILSPDYRIEDGVFISGWKVEKKPDEDGYVPSQEDQPCDSPTLRQRVELLESANDDMILLMADLIGGT